MSVPAAKPAWCSKLPRPQYSSLERIAVPSQQWFEVYRIRPNLFALYEPYHWEESIAYLMIGTEHSLLIDTGMGIGNIRHVIDALVSPSTSLKIINTHTHHDHVGDNWRFAGRILGVRSEFGESNARGSIEEAQNEMQPGMIWEKYLPDGFDRASYRIHPFQINEYLQEGDRIRLGEGQELQVISTPGHSPDSISLLDEQQRLLFVGDAFYQGPILLYRPETDLQDYMNSLETLAKVSTKVDLILPGHNTPNVEPQLLLKAARAMRDVLAGKAIGREADGGQHREFNYGDFSFVVDPSFL